MNFTKEIKTNYKRIITAILIFTFSFMMIGDSFSLYSQSKGIEEELLKAERLYEEGEYKEGLKILDDIIEIAKTKKELSDIYFLQALLNYGEGDIEKTKKSLRNLFRFDKSRTITKDNYAEGFVKLYSSAKIKTLIGTRAKSGVIIEKKKEKKKKKKFPWLLVLGGIAIIAIAIILLGKKKEDSESEEQQNISAAMQVYNSIKWVQVSAGEFNMGSPEGEGDSDEHPQHKVYLDAYYISKYEITFDQYDKFCEDTGRSKPSDNGWGRGNRPVINVSWDEAKAFCDWLSKGTGKKIALPTEAQWEKAARGGNKSKGYEYSGSNNVDEVGWYGDNSGHETHPVGQKKPNELGIYDMSGNVYEWCSDWYSSSYYSSSPRNNPEGPSSGSCRVRRGGGWSSSAWTLRCANRHDRDPSFRSDLLGFRIVKTE